MMYHTYYTAQIGLLSNLEICSNLYMGCIPEEMSMLSNLLSSVFRGKIVRLSNLPNSLESIFLSEPFYDRQSPPRLSKW